MSSVNNIAKSWIGGLGVYEPGKPIEEVAREMGLDPDEVIKLASNENALGPSPAAIKAIRDAAESMHLYPDGGCFYLKRDLAGHLGVTPEQIVLGNGSNELLELAGHVFLEPGTNIVMADRAFVVYRLLAALNEAEVRAVPMKDHTHDLTAMLAAIDDNTRIVFISNPNNPTGTMVDSADLSSFIADCPDSVVIALDEAYIELVPPERRPDSIRLVNNSSAGNVVLFRTFSKTYGLAGLRIGYSIASPDCAALLNRVRQPFNVNAMAQTAARAALTDIDHVTATRALVRDGLQYFQTSFSEMGLQFVPSTANFILVEVGGGRSVFEALQRKGVIVRPMDGYGMPDHIRITVGTRSENEQCIQTLIEVLDR